MGTGKLFRGSEKEQETQRCCVSATNQLGREGGRRERDGGREGWRERLRRNGEKERKERRVRWNEGEHQIEGLLAEEAERG